jgi:predicted dehydrogenase
MKKVCIVYETGNGRLAGHYTQFAFSGLPGVEIAALADGNEAAEKTFHLCGAKKLYKDYKEMLELEKPDIAVFCSRLVDEHYEQIKFAIERGIHVLCEKPLTSNLEEAAELICLAKKNKCKIQIAHLARFAPTFIQMKKLIEEGAIGKVTTCYMRGKEDHRGGGEDMMVLGTHLLDIAVYLFGKPLSVMSDIRNNGELIKKGEFLSTDEPIGPCTGDEVYSLYRFANGVNGLFESRRNTVVYGNDNRMGITVVGDKGSLSVRYRGERELKICRNFPVPPEDNALFEKIDVPEAPPIEDADILDYEKWKVDYSKFHFRYFLENNRRAAWNLLQSIENDCEPIAGIESAVDSIEMIQGAYKSALERRLISFPLADKKHPLL